MALNLRTNPIVIQGPASGSLASGITIESITGLALAGPPAVSTFSATLTRIGLPAAILNIAYNCVGQHLPLPFPTPIRHTQGFRFVVVGSGTLYLFL
jgi:hypothetical protein